MKNILFHKDGDVTTIIGLDPDDSGYVVIEQSDHSSAFCFSFDASEWEEMKKFIDKIFYGEE